MGVAATKAKSKAQVQSIDPMQDPSAFLWRRVALLALAVGCALAIVTLLTLLVGLWQPPGAEGAMTVASAAMAVGGAAVMAFGLTRPRRFPGEAFAAGGLLLWCLATMSGGDARAWLAIPAFLAAWASLLVDLAADTRIAVFLAHFMPLDAALDDLGLEAGSGNLTGLLAALYLLVLLVALPLGRPWRGAVAGFAGCAVAAALVVGVGYGTWTWRIALYFLAVLLYGAAVYALWRLRWGPPRPLLARP